LAALDDAEAGLDTARQAVRDQAALAGCKANCRELLQAAVDAASREAEARRADVSRIPAPVQVDDISTVTGVDAWKFSAVFALLMSLATNGLGAVLIARSAHGVAPKVVERRVLDMEWEPKIKVAEQPNTFHTFQPLPPKPRKKRRKQFPENVVNLESHKVFRALRKVSKPVSNSELAHLLSETEGEASKSWREIADHLEVHREGRELRIALRA
jgi:hypothetical protein